jgi:hypothetical protein
MTSRSRPKGAAAFALNALVEAHHVNSLGVPPEIIEACQAWCAPEPDVSFNLGPHPSQMGMQLCGTLGTTR